jgi:hypothetical protein
LPPGQTGLLLVGVLVGPVIVTVTVPVPLQLLLSVTVTV